MILLRWYVAYNTTDGGLQSKDISYKTLYQKLNLNDITLLSVEIWMLIRKYG